MDFLYSLVAVVLLCARLEAISTQTNVDTEEPTIIRSPALGTDRDDGFGWTAVLHQMEEVMSTDSLSEALRKTRILVGAPKGTYPGGLNSLPDPGSPRVDRTGLVFSCPIGQGNCVGVRGEESLYLSNVNFTDSITTVDVTGQLDTFYQREISEGRLFDQSPNANVSVFRVTDRVLFERKFEQLMGATIESNGDHVIACAYRWTTTALNPRDSQPRGICYVGERNLTGFRTIFPCIGTGTSESTEGPGYCISGFSAALVGDRVFVGAPGYAFTLGSVFSRRVRETLTTPYLRIHPGDFTTTIAFGYQIVSGYVRSNDRSMDPPDIVISSPRFNSTTYRGAVYLISSSSTAPTVDISNIIANGAQVAEFFGYALALCDLTGDGYDELVVGAPMYSTFTPSSLVERGRIYIYFNNAGTLDSNNPVIIEGAEANIRFGSALLNAGDLDADGHEDLVVGAPYKRSVNASLSNTGSIYVYYGRDTPEEFKNQIPQEIHADNIVDSARDVTILRTFGFSLSGNIDVDNNKHNDFAVGGYVDQTVVVLRTLPFVNITVNINPVSPVNLETMPSFTITVEASYETAATIRDLNVRFTLTEMGERDPRLVTSADNTVGEGMLNFTGDTATTSVEVFTISDIISLEPYQFQLDLVDINRNFPPVANNFVSNLSSFPRLRLQGDPTLSVNISNPCGNDGCLSDIDLSPVVPEGKELVAGRDSRVSFNLTYQNNGEEEARGLMLLFTGLLSQYFTSITLSPIVMGNIASDTFDCNFEKSTNNASCALQRRVRVNETLMASLVLVVDPNSFVGNESNFTVGLEVIVDTSNRNRDVNEANNQQTIVFSLDSQANIGVTMSYGRRTYNYVAMAPMGTVTSISDLGELVVLTVRVTNDGPSTIQNARVDIYIPTQSRDITGNNFFLYPSTVSNPDNVVCSITGFDPQNLIQDNMQGGRRKRYVAMNIKTSRARRSARLASMRSRRQDSSAPDVTLNCDTSSCLNFSCDIRSLPVGDVQILVDSNIDERFFAASANSRKFSFTASSSVSILDDFQRMDDNINDNTATATVLLVPLEVTTTQEDENILHLVLWPAIGGLIILVVAVVILYCVGFFRRKKKPGDEEIEGDFTAPPQEPTTKTAEITQM